MKKKIVALLSASVLLTMVLAGCGGADDGAEVGSNDGTSKKPIVFKLADNQPKESPLGESNLKFSELVEEKTNGEVKIEVHLNASLGEEAEITEQVKAGVMDMARINIIQLGQFVEEYNAFSLPYIFNDDAHRWAVVDGEIGKEVNEKLTDATTMHLLGYLDSGWRCFYTNEPVESVSDLKGKKIRVMDSAANIDMITALGATATPMPYADVFTALQTGVIDGAENDYVSYTTSGHSEVSKYYTVDRHTASFGVLLMSDKAKNMLSEEQYAIVQECADEAIAWQREAMLEKQESSKEEAIANGSTVIDVDITEFQEAVNPMYDDYAELNTIIEKIKSVK